jgi:hypothetical protein
MEAAMDRLSEHACVILESMEPGRLYGPHALRAFLPDESIERVREIMHELWIDRQVERVGYSGWRRLRSLPRPQPVSLEVRLVKPEELFDHDSFADFFK